MVQYKRQMNELQYSISKFNLILGIRAVKSVLYLRMMLEKIRIVKQVFALQVEQGIEVYIPDELQ